jgi:hypothetical protein
MKTIIYLRFITSLLGLFAIVSCASKPTPKPNFLAKKEPPRLTKKETSGLRYSESLKRYSVGRYRDPHNPGVMHEAHDLYRVERSPKWKLHPQRTASNLSRTLTATKTASPSREQARLKRELQQERASNRILMKAHRDIKDQVEPLTQAVAQAKQLATENRELRRQIESLNQVKEPTPQNEPPNSSSTKETKPASFRDWLPTPRNPETN